MATKKENLPPEWSHMIDIDAVERWPLKIEVSPQDSERSNLVKRLGLLSLDDCDAKLTLRRENQVIHVNGTLSARVRQNCVVTMEPVEGEIEESFEAWYADPDQAVSLSKARRDKQVEKGRGEMPILSEQEDPESIINGKIDVGELVTQYLSLSIDPYPHAEGVELSDVQEAVIVAEAEADPRENPFAALKDWKNNQDKGGA